MRVNLPVQPDDRPRVQHELVLRLTVDGEPVPKGRPRFGRGRTYTPAKTRAAEEAIAWQVKASGRTIYGPETGPLALRCDFYRATGKTADVDNLLKLVTDALNGVIWKDDRQIVQVQANRHDRDPNPRTEIAVYRVVR